MRMPPLLALTASLVIGIPAFAQPPGDNAPVQPPAVPPKPADAPAPQAGMQPLKPIPVVVNPPFDRLAKVDPATKKIVRIEGMLDILAIPRNTFVDAATREKIRPLVKAWVADVDQLAIDNLDFMEKIEPEDGSKGVIETVNINDMATVHAVAQMMTQLMSAGPLSNHLELKEGFTREQSQRNQEIVSDYLQQVMNEVMAERGVPNDKDRKDLNDEERLLQINGVSHFLYYMSCRDAIESYHRLLQDAAPIMDQITGQLTLTADQKAKIKPLLGPCKDASDPVAKRKASRAVLSVLDFDQRRAALSKVTEIKGPWDAVAELGPAIPPPPGAGQPVSQQTPTPAPTPSPAQPGK